VGGEPAKLTRVKDRRAKTGILRIIPGLHWKIRPGRSWEEFFENLKRRQLLSGETARAVGRFSKFVNRDRWNNGMEASVDSSIGSEIRLQVLRKLGGNGPALGSRRPSTPFQAHE
jgi:hypothetical protein